MEILSLIPDVLLCDEIPVSFLEDCSTELFSPFTFSTPSTRAIYCNYTYHYLNTH